MRSNVNTCSRNNGRPRGWGSPGDSAARFLRPTAAPHRPPVCRPSQHVLDVRPTVESVYPPPQRHVIKYIWNIRKWLRRVSAGAASSSASGVRGDATVERFEPRVEEDERGVAASLCAKVATIVAVPHH
ncbi:hypothetical protein A0H81_09408 [Grifola frondosa]|uniref:Uncharacterized protein n=1 Tax=Grifola frondosa TaxID=5627 RepID=A0A1C7M7J8_GRIFR|nr:hypothetical protein A0H81_09408 [Grifola frondosa]